MKPKKKVLRCINPNCTSRNNSGHRPPARSWGLCQACAKAYERLRKAGKITDDKALRLGIIERMRKPGANRFPELADK